MSRTMRHVVPMLCLSLLAGSALADAPETPPEQVLVVGQKPGPGMWKVTRGDHVMWVFGSYGPLPKAMEWRSQQVEAVMAQSQEFLTEPGANYSVGILRGITLLPFAIGAKNNPNGEKLREVVPADTYERWLALKKKYIGEDSGIEKERPVFAAGALYDKALRQSGLTRAVDLREQMLALAKKNKLKITSATVTLDVDSPVKALREFKKQQLADLPCFTRTIERLETDLDTVRLRANAWAKGDIDTIRKLGYQDQAADCSRAFMENTALQEHGFRDMENRIREKWIVAVETALIANKSTVAMLPIKQILAEDGMFAALQARGYKVEHPD
ncbi:TraB family protein [Pseudoduganella lurida]|uniref:TraB family protein n=1 Tax=Pseudoduganella lurida TaxID=1036180 RepID=A0A562QZE1_9BURK|nr:TraB/GumN family protein [Pseudoduganella lurida]TWI61570.1 TraB family protein [Pseudoduganella lurida]